MVRDGLLCLALSSLVLPMTWSFSSGPKISLRSHALNRVPSSCQRVASRIPRFRTHSQVSMSGFFSNLFGEASNEDQENLERVVSAITAPEGWSVKLEIGSEIARALGGSGTIAKGDVMNVNIGVAVRMERDEGYDPPQGSVFIESESSIFSGESFWSVIEDTDGGVPTAIQAILKCPQGIKLSGELVVPEGQIFLNFKVKEESKAGAAPEVQLYNGRVTVKEAVKSSFLLTSYDGLLAEFKIIGTCAAKPRASRAEEQQK